MKYNPQQRFSMVLNFVRLSLATMFAALHTPALLAESSFASTTVVDSGDELPSASIVDSGFQLFRRSPKVMIMSMYGGEGKVWIDRLGPWREYKVDGLSPDYPVVRCNKHDVCVVTTGEGHANAAASMMALTFSGRFD